MDRVKSFDVDSKLVRTASGQPLTISSNKEKGIIKVNGGGSIIIIHDESISSCKAEKNGVLSMDTNGGRKIIFSSDSRSGTIKLRAQLNRVLAQSNCELRFEESTEEEFVQSQGQSANNIRTLLFHPYSLLLILGFSFLMVFLNSNNSTTNAQKDATKSPAVAEGWEAKRKRELAEWDKQRKKEEKLEAKVNTQQSVPTSPTPPTSGSTDTEVASIMLSVSCAGSKGLIPRNQMGSMMKEMFQSKGIDSTEVYGNWDYYWGIAKEMDKVNQTYCIQ